MELLVMEVEVEVKTMKGREREKAILMEGNNRKILRMTQTLNNFRGFREETMETIFQQVRHTKQITFLSCACISIATDS
jgi:hypothetical protein